MHNDVLKLATIGLYKNKFPCTLLHDDMDASPALLAALCVSLFESYITRVEDSKQITYEKNFKNAFKKMLKDRHQYTSMVEIKNEL